MSVQRYAMPQIMVHWAVVLLVMIQYFFHDGMEEAFEAVVETGGRVVNFGAILHILAGVAVFALTIYRIVLRRRLGTPPLPESEPIWQKRVADITHKALLALLLLMPVGGIVAWIGGSETAADIHGAAATALFFLLVLHVGAAFYGQYIAKRRTMDRMRPV